MLSDPFPFFTSGVARPVALDLPPRGSVAPVAQAVEHLELGFVDGRIRGRGGFLSSRESFVQQGLQARHQISPRGREILALPGIRLEVVELDLPAQAVADELVALADQGDLLGQLLGDADRLEVDLKEAVQA